MAKQLFTIRVHPDLMNTTEVSDLVSAGHAVSVLPDDLHECLILAPNARRMRPELLKYLDVCLIGHSRDKKGTALVSTTTVSKPKRKTRKKKQADNPVLPGQLELPTELNTQLDGGSSDASPDDPTPTAPPLHPPA